MSESWRLFACWVSPDRGVTVSSVISATLSSGRPNGDFRYGDAKAEMFERRLEKSPGDDFFAFASPEGTRASAEGENPGMSSSERRVASSQSARNSASLSPIFNLSSASLRYSSMFAVPSRSFDALEASTLRFILSETAVASRFLSAMSKEPKRSSTVP